MSISWNILKRNSTKRRSSEYAVNMSKTEDTLRPIRCLSLLVGYTSRQYRLRGTLGLLLFLISLLANGMFDFQEARKIYGYAWGSVTVFHMLVCFISMYCVTRVGLPWLERGMRKLEKDDKYFNTFYRITIVSKKLPWLVLLFGLSTAGIQFFCLHRDNAFHVDLGQNLTTTYIIPLKIARFITMFHVMMGFAIFWSIPVCIMLMTGYSMIEYQEEMTRHLKNKETPITFRQAVHSFAERAKFVQKSASSCSVTLTLLLVYSVAALAINAYYFLYKIRHALYVPYALIPIFCSVYPLCNAAWVTKQYKWYIAVVVKAWAERPESSSEEEESEPEYRGTRESKQKRPQSRFFKAASNVKQSREKLKNTHIKAVVGGSHSDSETRVEDLRLANGGYINNLRTPPFDNLSRSDTDKSDDNDETKTNSAAKEADKPKPGRHRLANLTNILRGTAKAVGRLQHRIKRPKFNFEKYISYLQNVMPTVGFCIAGVVISWNMVSTLLFLEFSLLSLFVQESIFGSQTATVQL